MVSLPLFEAVESDLVVTAALQSGRNGLGGLEQPARRVEWFPKSLSAWPVRPDQAESNPKRQYWRADLAGKGAGIPGFPQFVLIQK
jgi:hypothetical protein